jgi:Flp pilus assembly pilin Flp
MHGHSARAKSNRKESTFMMDRFNVWVGSLVARSHDIKKDEGQTFVEYALILAVVVVAVLLAVTWTGLGDAIGEAITAVEDAISGTPAP